MANDSKNDDFPTIRLDEEDRKAYQQKKHSASRTTKAEDNSRTSTVSSSSSPSPTTQKSGGNGLWITLVALVALTGVGGSYYLYTLLEKQQASAVQAEKRIAQLEQRLSATGEEIGESTVALQVRVKELSDRTEELWDQMDKLWASAWRRNQQEIAELGDKVKSVQTSMTSSVNGVSETVTDQQKKLASVSNQLSGFADELLALNVQLDQAASNRSQQDKSVSSLKEQISVIEKRNSSLVNRLNEMENDIRDIATKVVSRPSSSSPQ